MNFFITLNAAIETIDCCDESTTDTLEAKSLFRMRRMLDFKRRLESTIFMKRMLVKSIGNFPDLNHLKRLGFEREKKGVTN